MARRINTDEHIYRAKITNRVYVPNPDYRVVYDSEGSHSEGGDRYIYSDTELYTKTYGPYEKIGSAKAHITKAAKTWSGDANPAFVGGPCNLHQG